MNDQALFDQVIKKTANVQRKRKVRMTNQDQLMEMANRSARSGVAILDAMFQRGAIKGEEAETVGNLRNQFIQVVQLYEQIQQEKAAEADETEES